MKAIKIVSPGVAKLRTDVPVPAVRPDYLLVKTVCVALNPTDWKHIDRIQGTVGCTSGCDYSGTVVEVGENVKAPFKKGDRVAGFTHGGKSVDRESGAFGEYLLAKGDLQMLLPETVSFEEAATVGAGLVTVGQGLYQSLELPLPNRPAEKGYPILIYGASTATGTLAVQFAKLSGLQVIAVCSAHNFELVKSLGADAVFDYHAPTCGSDIRAYTNNSLYYAFDCISEHDSPQICADALSSDTAERRPVYSALLVVKFPRADVEHKYTLGYTALGEYFRYTHKEFPPQPEDFKFACMFTKLAKGLLEEGKFKVHPPEVRPGGLRGVLVGLDDLRKNQVSGKKLVYRVAETEE